MSFQNVLLRSRKKVVARVKKSSLFIYSNVLDQSRKITSAASSSSVAGSRSTLTDTSAMTVPSPLVSVMVPLASILIGNGDLAGRVILLLPLNAVGAIGHGGNAIFTGLLMMGTLNVQLAPHAAQSNFNGMMEALRSTESLIQS